MNACRHYLLANMPYDLLHFLIKENCLKEYVSHTLPCKLIDTIELFITYINDNPSHSIDAAFSWVDTESGWKYWNFKNLKWRMYLEEKYSCIPKHLNKRLSSYKNLKHHHEKENNIHIS